MAKSGKKNILRYVPLVVICILMLFNLLNHFFVIIPRSNTSVGFRDVDCPNVETLTGDLYPNVEYQAFTYEPEERELTLFNEYGGGKTVRFMWGGKLFDHGSYIYDHNLCLAANSIVNIGIWTTLSLSPEVYAHAMESLGLTNTETWVAETYNVDRPEMHISSATLGDRAFVVVNVRGSFSVGDYATDLKAVYDGFGPASFYVRDNILGYVDRNFPDKGREDISLLIVGHSLGGACAGLQAPLMEEAGFAKEKTFIYTLASPKYHLNGSAKDYPNVFNTIVDRDVVPRVPLLDGRYGTDLRYQSVYVGYSALGMIESALRNKTDPIYSNIISYHSVMNYLQSADSGNVSHTSTAKGMLFFAGELFLNSVQIALR